MKIKEITRVCKGRLLHGAGSTRISGVSINSRSILRGELFVAVKGQRYDGHNFVQAAIRKGAAGVIVSKKIKCSGDVAFVYVKDTVKALGHIAAYHRRQFDIPLIAVTGSAGKTTTKDMVAAVLETNFKVLKNNKTENNQFGVPLTLLKLNASHQVAVLELGTNQPGDIRALAKIVHPTAAIITNIGASHLERLKSIKGVFREKVQLLKQVVPGGVILLNGDDPHLNTINKSPRGVKLIYYGLSAKNDYQADGVRIQDNCRIQFNVGLNRFGLKSPVRHNIYNALAAISCGREHKIRYNDIRATLSKFKFSGARQEILRVGPCWLIDDTYNANPLSFMSAIETLSRLRIRGKKIIVCGDMLELGPHAKKLHLKMAECVVGSGINVVVTIGRNANAIAKYIIHANRGTLAFHCRNTGEMHRKLKGLCKPRDAVLIKGSRGMHMEQTVTYLKRLFQT